jgi:hypothetical protein
MNVDIKELGTIVAERQFSGQEDGKPCQVVVRIGKPFPNENKAECWYCPYSITMGTAQRVFYGGAWTPFKH